MQKTEAYYKDLLSRFIGNTLPSNQVEELFDFIQQYPEIYDLLLNEEVIREKLSRQAFYIEVPEMVSNRMKKRLLLAIQESGNVKTIPAVEKEGVDLEVSRLFSLKFYWRRVGAIAAALLILAASSVYFWNHQKDQKRNVVVKSGKVQQDILPGKQGAILTLADGKQVVLDKLDNGIVTTQGNQQVVLSNGKILYKGIDGTVPEKLLYNTMSTPKGRQYQLVLPDGSKVWLNSASSITFPIAFIGSERRVTITGEVYFEVAHLSSKDGAGKVPFIVKIDALSGNGGEVEVVGTHFNINAYGDVSAIKTTLLEGSVRLRKGSGSLLIKPGQQGVFSNSPSDNISVIPNVDLEQLMAWKEGIFNFEGADLKTVLRQLGRWYDLDIIYEGTIPQRTFGGEIPMNLNLSQALLVLEKVEVKYRMDGKKLIVSP